MSRHSRTLTKTDLIEAIRKNGYPQAFGKMLQYQYQKSGGIELSACAMGQAAINLHIAPFILEDILRRIGMGGPQSLANFIINLNDGDRLSLEKIADLVEKEAPNFSVGHSSPFFTHE
jgi:hypothetical protein